MNRIFISYRSSDGKRDAARLASDLNGRFGEQLVFYDKEDLLGGSSWREAIQATLGTQPVVLLLVTPDLLGALHPEGGRRIDREDDPIRNEVLAARQSGARILPVLTEGMQMPAPHTLPQPLRFITETHARPLRIDDWGRDLDRIVEDLRAHRVLPAQPPDLPGYTRILSGRIQRWLMLVGGGFVGLVALGLLLPPAPPEAPAPGVQTLASPGIAGVWWMDGGGGPAVRVQIQALAGKVQLRSDPVPVSADPGWQAYARELAGRGQALAALRYQGSGTWNDDRLEMPYEVHGDEGQGLLDTGQITLSLDSNGQHLQGTIWSNGDQAAKPLRLARRP